MTDKQAVLFQLDRIADHSGVSGTGIVADGVEFPDGTVALRWRGDVQSTVIYDSLEDVIKIHGHGGATQLKFVTKGDYEPHIYAVRADRISGISREGRLV